MSQFYRTIPPTQSHAPYGVTSIDPAMFYGVRTRRIMAVCLDFTIVCFLVAAASVAFFLVLAPLGIVAGLLGFGLSWLVVPPLFPLIAFFYNGFTVAGRHMATPGMRMANLQVRHVDGSPASFISAAAHAVLFYFSWMVPPVFLVSLVTQDKACLHDMIAGVRVMRRSW